MPESLEITEYHEIFKTEKNSVHFSGRTEQFSLNIFGESVLLSFSDLRLFKNKLESIDLAELLTVSRHGIEIIHLVRPDKLLVLTILEILELKDLLNGVFTMLDLNSLIHRALVRQDLMNC